MEVQGLWGLIQAKHRLNHFWIVCGTERQIAGWLCGTRPMVRIILTVITHDDGAISEVQFLIQVASANRVRNIACR